MKSTSEMQMVEIGRLVPYVNNARTHSPEQVNKIRSSLREFGFVNPLIIDREYNVLAGHGRLMAAKEEGYEEVPCVFVDEMSEAQKKAYILADNRYAMDAGWDEDLPAVEMESLQEMGFDLALTGFDEKEIADLFAIDAEGEEDNFDVDAELEKPCFSLGGDIWHLGKHKVICGDSTLADTFALLMAGEKADIVLTDPPYNVNVEETAGKILNDNMGDAEFHDFLLKAYTQMYENLADDGSIYVFHADTEGLNFRLAFKETGFHLSGCCIWSKNGRFALGRSPYQWAHEPCLFGWKKKHQWYSDRKQTTVWNFDKPAASKDHPTMKPIELLCYPLKNSSMTNSIVLDPFLGSGSTLIACEQMERVCRGVELDPKFVDVIVKRYIEFKKGDASDVYVERDGETIPYSEVPMPEVEDGE